MVPYCFAGFIIELVLTIAVIISSSYGAYNAIQILRLPEIPKGRALCGHGFAAGGANCAGGGGGDGGDGGG